MSNTIILPIIIFMAALFQSTFGFGLALLSIPLLTIFISITTATPLLALIGSLNALGILLLSRKNVAWNSIWRLIMGSILGAPLGIWLLINASESLVKTILGVFLILYGIYNLLPTNLPELKNERWGYLFGFFAGVLGSAYDINGPPVLFYGTMRRWDPQKFRSSLAGFFLPSNIIISISHFSSGLITSEILKYFMLSIPGIFLATWLGTIFNKRFKTEKFNRYLYILIILLGAYLIITSWLQTV
ncbi:MAG: sulfite exporter TauE/SafE family protein [Anaerolineaceae bacterium]|nr:sulfite exporter TauE/SafE family protein [Anaerolineaceae bacterium]